MKVKDHCSISDCSRVKNAKGLCRMHYIRQWRWGSPYTKKRNLFTGNSSHELYRTYDAMKQRCLNSNSVNYPNYGARGIKVCSRWLGADGFTSFLNDMGARPFGYTLERLDVDGDYTPENCVWASWFDQAANKRGANLMPGVTYSQARQKWVATIGSRGKNTFLGRFNRYEDAAQARQAALAEVLKTVGNR